MAEDIASTWLQGLSLSLQRRDIGGFVNLFLPTGCLRDILVFTWDIRTLYGHEKISAYISENIHTCSLSGFRLSLSDDEYFRPTFGSHEPGNTSNSVSSRFEFSTPIANGQGFLSLELSPDGEFKASVLLMTLDSLKGYEEKDPVRDIYQSHNLPTWSEARNEKWKEVEKEPQALIIGAGQNGLQIAARFRQMQISTLVVERNARVGDTWRRRYPSLVLHTPKSHHNLLYQPFPKNWPVWTPRDKLADWLEQYATAQELLVWTNSFVLPNPSYDPNTRRWTVAIDKSGHIVTVHPQHVIVATGMVGEPYMPAPTIQGHDLFQGEILHTSTFNGGRHFSGKRVVIVGTGNSGADVALDLSLHGAESVTMVQRSSTCVQPASTVVKLLLGAWPLDVPQDVLDFRSLIQPLKHIVENLGRARPSMWDQEKDLIEGLRNMGLKVDMGPEDAGVLPLVIQRFGGFWMDVGCGAKVLSGEIKVKSGTTVQEFTTKTVGFADGSSLEADVVIFATGYYSMGHTLKTLFGNFLRNTDALPGVLNDEDEYVGGYKPTGHPGLWCAPGSFEQARVKSKFLGIQIQALDLGYMTLD